MSSSPDLLHPGARRPHRVVVLISDEVMPRHTGAVLVRAGVHVVGLVICGRESFLERLQFVTRWARRHGAFTTFGQILGRLVDRSANGTRDERVLHALVDPAADETSIRSAGFPVYRTDSYSRPDTLAAIRALDPDVFVVHTKYIVGKSVRALARVAVIGGHPGVTPHYRGAYSPFWALLHGRPDMVGYTVFLLDDGVDTGPILYQDVVPIEHGVDSHLTLAWKGMIRQAELQASAIKRLDAGESLPLRAVREVPPDSYFGPPTLWDMVRYRRAQRTAR